jgi:hypothetical protein
VADGIAVARVHRRRGGAQEEKAFVSLHSRYRKLRARQSDPPRTTVVSFSTKQKGHVITCPFLG